MVQSRDGDIKDPLLSRALAVFGAVAAVFGAVLLYARHELFAPDALADHAASALDDESVRMAVAPTIVAAIGEVSPGGPPTDGQVAKALADPRVRDAFGAAAGVATQRLFDRGSQGLDLDLAKVAEISVARTSGRAPDELGVPDAAFESVRLHLIGAQAVLDGLDALERVSWLGFVLTPLGLIALVLSVALAPGALRGASRAALAVAIVAALAFAALYVGREVAAAQFDDQLTRDAVADAWGAVLGGLRTALLVAAGASIVAAAGFGVAAGRRHPSR